MLNRITDILKGLKDRKGQHILLATGFAKLLSFAASYLALLLLDDEKLGLVIFAHTLVSFVIPLSGMGLHQSLLRYGALQHQPKEKNILFRYVAEKGLIASLILTGFVIFTAYIINGIFPNIKWYLIVLSFAIPTTFLLEIIKIQFRLRNENSRFASTELAHGIVLLVTVVLLSKFLGEMGYALALVTTPLLTALLFFKSMDIGMAKTDQKPNPVDYSFFKYGFFTSLSNVATKLLSTIDIILIGILLPSAVMVTIYKYLLLVPMSLLFLSSVVITTDFVNLTEKIYRKDYTYNYIKNYLALFIGIGIVISFILISFANDILILFGDEFLDYALSFKILVIGILGILIIRGLYGNLLSALGKARMNYRIALLGIVLNIGLNYWLIPIYGLLGAAITSSLLMWVSGILSAVIFHYYYRKTKTAEE